MLTQRRTLYAFTERGVGAIVARGSGKCRKVMRALDAAYASGPPEEARINGEARLVLRARCGLCAHRSTCKKPLY